MSGSVPGTIFSQFLGTRQGRVAPANFTPVSGTEVYVLGDDVAGHIGQFKVGDYEEVSQYFTSNAVSFIRGTIRARPPTLTMPGGTSWKLSILVDGTEQISYTLGSSSRTLTDYVANVSKTTGAHRVQYRLTLDGTPGTTAYTVELPGIYLDALTADTSTAYPVVVNRTPQPNETAVAFASNIQLDIVDTLANSVSLAGTSIYVNGVLAFVGGVFQTGFTGAGSTYSTPRSDTLRVVIDPTTNFTSSQLVTVRVVTSASSVSLDQSYTFTCLDTTAPTLNITAMAIELQRVRLTFSEAMRMSSATGTNDALNPANYSLARDPSMDSTVPSVVPTVVSVESVSSTQVNIITDIPLTPGASYIVTVTNAADVAGNVIQAPTNVADFTGWVPPKPAGRNFDLYQYFSVTNRREDAAHDYALKRYLGCLQELITLLLYDIDLFFQRTRDPDYSDEKYLDAMLSELGNPFPFELTENKKRKLVQNLIPLMAQRGTGPGIINAIRLLLDLEVTISEVNQAFWRLNVSQLGISTILGGSGRVPFSFSICAPVALTSTQLSQLTTIVNIMKPANTHLLRVDNPC